MACTPFDYFDRCYVVNLASRTDRRRETEAELSRAQIPSDAVRWWEATYDRNSHGFPSPGAYGCFQSHLRALRQAHKDGVANVLMLEDDIMLRPGSLREWPAIEDYLEAHEWDLLNLGYAHTVEGPSLNEELVRVRSPVKATHCYAVNGGSIPILIDFLVDLQGRDNGDSRGGKMHYDGALNVFCAQHPGIVRLAARNKAVFQRSSRSDIARVGWFDEHVVLRSVASRLRGAKNALRRRKM